MASSFQIPSLRDLPQSLVDDVTAMLAARLAEYNPDIDFNSRAAFLTMPYMHGLLLSGTIQNLVNELSTNNLASLLDGTATDAQADEIAKAFNITRKPSQKSRLAVLIVLSSAVPFGLSTGDTLTNNGVSFSVDSSISVRASRSSLSSGSDYVLTQIGTGKWGVVIPVTAKLPGTNGNLAPGALLTCSKQITSLVKISVVSLLRTGYEEETSQQMASRVLAASSIKTWAGRSSFEAIARQNTTYSDLVGISVCGFGDAEQRRDRRGVLPVAHGGRTDLWVKFRPSLYSTQQQVTAVLTSKVGAIGTWSFTLNGSSYPAVTRVSFMTAVDDQSGDSFVPANELWTLGVPVGVVIPKATSDRYVPDVRTAQEAAYSAYVNTTVLFEDYRYDVSSLPIGTTRSYLAHIVYEPLVETFQQELGASSSANPGGDVLVKAAIPCELAVTVTVSMYPGKTAPASADIADAVLNFINTTTFPGTISASDISSAAGTVVNGVGTIVVNYMSGSLKKPDGTQLALAFQDGKISVPELPVEMVSKNTVAFYSDISKVSVIIQ